jgi:hypothetical protein
MVATPVEVTQSYDETTCTRRRTSARNARPPAKRLVTIRSDMSDKLPFVWLVRELYAMHKAGKLANAEARWILVVAYGEKAVEALGRDKK